MNKINVLLVAPSISLKGGISKWTKNILNCYKEHKEDCNLDYLSTVRYKHSVEHGIYARLSAGIFIVTNFWKRVSDIKYDMVHITTSASFSLIKDLFIIKIAKYYNIKSIVHFHFGRIPDLAKVKNWEWRLLKKVLISSDVAITIDLKSYSTLTSLGFNNIVYLPNPLSNGVINSVVKENSLIVQDRVVTFVGQMLKTKGIYELVEVCSQISDVKLNMYGSLPVGTKEKLELLAGKEHEKWLNIGGEIDYGSVISKMTESSVFVLPTYTEGFPNVILESMACGCSIIASAVGAIPEMLAIDTDNPCGICVEPKNKIQLKEAIEYMLDHPLEAREFGERAKKRVIEEYSIDSVWEKLLVIWNSTIENINNHVVI